MGHNPSPSAIQDCKGYFEKHPERKRPNEPKPKVPLSTTAPKDFTPEQKVAWKELMKMLLPGVAFDSDKWALRHLAILEAKYRFCVLNDKKYTADDHTKWLALLDRFGLNPSARTKVHGDAPPTDELEDFLAGYTPPNPKLQ